MGLCPLAPPITKHMGFIEEESIQDWPSGEGPGEDEQEEIEDGPIDSTNVRKGGSSPGSKYQWKIISHTQFRETAETWFHGS